MGSFSRIFMQMHKFSTPDRPPRRIALVVHLVQVLVYELLKLLKESKKIVINNLL